MVVLDASVTLAWILQEENLTYVNQIQDQVEMAGALVPAIWPLEVANGLVNAERRGRLQTGEVMRVMTFLFQYDITVEMEQSRTLMLETIGLARRYRLSTYDASYLHLAIERGLPLATIDQNLHRAALEAGVPLFGM